MSTTEPAPADVKGAGAEDESGTPLGTVDAVFLDDTSGRLGWVVVGEDAVVPATGARLDGGRLRLPVTAEAVRTAPRLGGRAHLDAEHLQALRDHYGLDAGRHGTGGRTGGVADVGGAGTDRGAMTLTEERLAVTTTREPYARAVLRVETVTEEVMVPVTVTRQRARIEHLPLATVTGEGGPALDVDAEGQASGWVTLYGEEPVVELRQVPIERVRLATSWTTTQQQVGAELRHEELALQDAPAQHSPSLG